MEVRVDPAGKPRVPIVDDDALYGTVVCEILEQSRVEVRHAADVCEAMGVLRVWKPDVLLLDVMLSGASGLALLKRLRSDPTWKSLPIVIASALAGKGDREAGLAEGANAYLTKPFGSSDLPRVLRRFVPVLGTAELHAEVAG